jgi:hypothetical protein
LKGLYRLVDGATVTHESVLRPHLERTRQLMREHDGAVLIIHDTTELDYTDITTLQAIGQIGNGSHRGYLCHNSLAVNPRTREVFGLANQILFCRPDVGQGETRDERRERGDAREPPVEAGFRGHRIGAEGASVGGCMRPRGRSDGVLGS